jgi:hypothetical protein
LGDSGRGSYQGFVGDEEGDVQMEVSPGAGIMSLALLSTEAALAC